MGIHTVSPGPIDFTPISIATSPIPRSLVKWKSRGAVAQLGERLVRNEEASGSIPLSSTMKSTTYPENPGTIRKTEAAKEQ
jgi:hypothetical protein